MRPGCVPYIGRWRGVGDMSEVKAVNRRTFKEVVTAKLGVLCDRLDISINRNLAKAEYYKKLGAGFDGVARNFENIANGLIDARHEAVTLGLEIEAGADL